jgi:hypothetical protein
MKHVEQFSGGNRSFNLASLIKVHQTITRPFVKFILSYILSLHNLLTSIGGHHNAPDALTGIQDIDYDYMCMQTSELLVYIVHCL